MWFKRRKKTQQDHALSESLRSLQSLLSESGRREPSLEPRAAQSRPDDEEPTVDAGRAQPATRRTPTASGAAEEPAVPEAGSRWRDLNLSFDAEPVAPRSRRDTEPGEATGDESAETDAQADAGESGDQVEDTALLKGGPIPTGTGAGAMADAAPATAEAPLPESAGEETAAAVEDEPMDETPDQPAAGEEPRTVADVEPPPTADEEPAAEDAVVYYDELKALETGSDTDVDSDGLRPGDEPDLELDLSAIETVDIQAPAEPDPADAPAPPAVHAFEETSPVDLRESGPAPADAGQGAGEPPDAAPATSVSEPVPDRCEEDQLPLELGLDDVSEDDIPTLTDVVYVPDGGAREPAAETEVPGLEARGDDRPEPEAAARPEPAAESEPAVDPESTSEPEPADELESAAQPELVEPEPPETASEPVQAAELETPVEAPPVPEPPAAGQPAPDIPPPGRRESPHDGAVERCIDKLRVRLQLMGLEALSRGQEKELHDTLADFLDDLNLE